MNWGKLTLLSRIVVSGVGCSNSAHWSHPSAAIEQALVDIREWRKLAKEKKRGPDHDGALGGIGAETYLRKGAYGLRQKAELNMRMESRGCAESDV